MGGGPSAPGPTEACRGCRGGRPLDLALQGLGAQASTRPSELLALLPGSPGCSLVLLRRPSPPGCVSPCRPLPTPGLCPHGCPSPYPGSLPGVAPWGRGSRTWPRSGGVGTAEAPEGQWSCGRAHRASRPGTVRERLCRKWAPGHRSVWWPRIRHGPGRATGPAGLRSTLHAGR